jgi:hypothetical protein
MKAKTGRSLASRLALDLAVSRVSLAAIKARTHVPLNEEELLSAVRLRDALKEEIAGWTTPTPIPEELVPRDDMRHHLEEALGTLTSVSRVVPARNQELLNRLVASLDRLVEAGGLPEKEATNLLDGLLDLGAGSCEAEGDLVYVDARAR